MAKRPAKYYIPETKVRVIAVKLRNMWLFSSIAFIIVYYWCVLYSILSTLIVVYLSCYSGDSIAESAPRIILLSTVSLFTTICPYVINLVKMSKKYRAAFYCVEKALINNSGINEAIIEGEDLISSAFDD